MTHRADEPLSESRVFAAPCGRGGGGSQRTRAYGTPAGTTLMLLNGEPLISFVLTTV
jgi:hypothetical protein